jgi:hypothetical protein
MASRPTGITASSSSGAPASGDPGAAAAIRQRAAEVRAAMARARAAPAGPAAAGAPVRNAQAGRDYNPLQGGQRGFAELHFNLSRNPTKATLLNTISDFKEMPQMTFQSLAQTLERRLAAGDDVRDLITLAKNQVYMYLNPGERRAVVEQRAFGGRKKTRKGKSRRRYTRRR